LNESELDVILEEGKKLGQEINIDAYLDVIFRANQKAVKEGNQMKKYPSLETVLIEGGFGPRLMEYGRTQGIEKTARNLLKMGMPIEDIAQATELPVEKIHSLAAVH
jgi:hypothetical protein